MVQDPDPDPDPPCSAWLADLPAYRFLAAKGLAHFAEPLCVSLGMAQVSHCVSAWVWHR